MKYHVYSIGNALVDSEFEVNDHFLQTNNIEKGLMTLVDEQQYKQISTQLTSLFGLKKQSGGGSAANSLVALSQLGGNAFYACKVADDDNGVFYCNDLALAGVETQVKPVVGASTGQCMVMVTPDAERTMNTYLGITSDFSVNELHTEILKQSEYLYIEGYLVTSDISREAAIKARELAKANNVKVALTFSDPAMATYFSSSLSEIIGEEIDLLFCNEEELLTYTNEKNLEDAIKKIHHTVKKVIITLGSKGVIVSSKQGQTKVNAIPVNAIDTNGAGDMFAGAFLYGITHGLSDKQSAELANKAAAEVVQVFGARLESSIYQTLKEKYS